MTGVQILATVCLVAVVLTPPKRERRTRSRVIWTAPPNAFTQIGAETPGLTADRSAPVPTSPDGLSPAILPGPSGLPSPLDAA